MNVFTHLLHAYKYVHVHISPKLNLKFASQSIQTIPPLRTPSLITRASPPHVTAGQARALSLRTSGKDASGGARTKPAAPALRPRLSRAGARPRSRRELVSWCKVLVRQAR